MTETHIIAYGGSVVCPKMTNNKPYYDLEAISLLGKLARKNPKDKFYFIIGGGALARYKQNLEKEKISSFLNINLNSKLKSPSELDNYVKNVLLDRIGILATRENAKKVLEILKNHLGFGEEVFDEVLIEPYGRVNPSIKSRIFVAGGHLPGASTDFVSMKYADNFNATKIHKVSNYPVMLNVRAKEFDKKRAHEYPVLRKTTFNEVIGLVGNPEDFEPGDSTPLDPSAAKLGLKLSQRNPSFMLNIGLEECLPKMVSGENFDGTIVKGTK